MTKSSLQQARCLVEVDSSASQKKNLVFSQWPRVSKIYHNSSLPVKPEKNSSTKELSAIPIWSNKLLESLMDDPMLLVISFSCPTLDSRSSLSRVVHGFLTPKGNVACVNGSTNEEQGAQISGPRNSKNVKTLKAVMNHSLSLSQTQLQPLSTSRNETALKPRYKTKICNHDKKRTTTRRNSEQRQENAQPRFIIGIGSTILPVGF